MPPRTLDESSVSAIPGKEAARRACAPGEPGPTQRLGHLLRHRSKVRRKNQGLEAPAEFRDPSCNLIKRPKPSSYNLKSGPPRNLPRDRNMNKPGYPLNRLLVGIPVCAGSLCFTAAALIFLDWFNLPKSTNGSLAILAIICGSIGLTAGVFHSTGLGPPATELKQFLIMRRAKRVAKHLGDTQGSTRTRTCW